MTTAFRRTAGRVVAAGLATAALAAAAIAGGQAARASTSCTDSTLVKTFDVVLSFRDALAPNPSQTCLPRQ